jgi:hypothetical protein
MVWIHDVCYKFNGTRTFMMILCFDLLSKCTKGAENVYAPLVIVYIWGRKRTLVDKTVYQNRSIDPSFDPPLFSLDSTFK